MEDGVAVKVQTSEDGARQVSLPICGMGCAQRTRTRPRNHSPTRETLTLILMMPVEHCASMRLTISAHLSFLYSQPINERVHK